MGEIPLVANAQAVKRLHADAAWAEERAAYYAMHSELLKQYEGQFVAVCQCRVAAHGHDKFEVALSAMKKFPQMPVFIHRVTAKPAPAVHVRRPLRNSRSV